jgi:hypothetical protein
MFNMLAIWEEKLKGLAQTLYDTLPPEAIIEDEPTEKKAAKLIVDLKNNNLKEYDLKWWNLRIVEMDDQQFEEILGLFFTKELSSKIIVLDVRGNNLQFLPKRIRECAELRVLNLSNNGLEVLPETLWNCSKLIRLNVEHNRLKALGEGIWQCSELESLYAAKNNLEEIPYALGGCLKLEKFSLDKIPSLTVPDTVRGFQQNWGSLLMTLRMFQNDRAKVLVRTFEALEFKIPSDVLRIVTSYIDHLHEYTELVPESPDFALRRERIPDSLTLLFSCYQRRFKLPEQQNNTCLPTPDTLAHRNATT